MSFSASGATSPSLRDMLHHFQYIILLFSKYFQEMNKDIVSDCDVRRVYASNARRDLPTAALTYDTPATSNVSLYMDSEIVHQSMCCISF